MALTLGARLGPYEVEAPLGVGGMGEVYRARDTRLDRVVALKIIAPVFATDSEFRERFYAEARAISQLSHPHICTLHDIGESDGTTFLVMELLVGETLAERLDRQNAGGPLPIELALKIAIQIADALTAAHRRGIVHRDLKPGNVMLTGMGRNLASTELHVKLLDFGLAKSSVASSLSSASVLATNPPQPLTAHGAIVGTVQYMAPEQIEGGHVDARSDIFAFGSLLYEMLTGRKAFEGKTQANVLAAILERDPPSFSALHPLPPILDALLRKCLVKNAEDRWQSAADLATALRWVLHRTPEGAGEARREGATIKARHPVMSLALILLFAGVAAGIAWTYGRPSNTPADMMRLEMQPPPDSMWSPSPVASATQFALAPDGRRIAFVAAPRRTVSRVWIRNFESTIAQSVPGTDGASFPFWSPDGRSVGFFADGQLKITDLSGSVPQRLAAAPSARGGSWSQSGDILFTPAPNGPVFRISRDRTVTQETTLVAADDHQDEGESGCSDQVTCSDSRVRRLNGYSKSVPTRRRT